MSFKFLNDPIKPRKIMTKNSRLQARIKGKERVFNPQNLKPTMMQKTLEGFRFHVHRTIKGHKRKTP